MQSMQKKDVGTTKTKFTCYSCNKSFKDNHHLQAHKDRKTPCVIRDIPAGDENNPLRCIFCNRTFCNAGNLNRHHTTCKIKNGGMDILVAKTKHEQEIELLKQQNVLLQQQVELLKRTNTTTNNSNYTNSTVNNTTNNIDNSTVNNNVNITFNAWNEPSFRHLVEPNHLGVPRFVELLQQHGVQTPLQLVPHIWFNPAVPCNLSIYLVNKKTQETLCWTGAKWQISAANQVGSHLREHCYQLTDELGETMNNRLSPSQQEFVYRTRINRPDRALTKLEIAEITRALQAGRALVKQHHTAIQAS